MRTLRNWTLGAKLFLVATPSLLIALCSIGALVWMSLQLEGGAASVNEAGRMRMQAYRMLLPAGAGAVPGNEAVLPQQVAEFERSLVLLRNGDPERPLFVPWDETVRQSFKTVERDWEHFRHLLEGAPAPAIQNNAGPNVAAFTAHIDGFVAAIEAHLSRWTSMMHLLQIALMALAVVGAAVLLYTGYLFVLEPVSLLKQAIHRIQGGELDARVDCPTTDEFGTLAAGFNDMAAQLQSMYRSLESKVHEKTARLEEKHERLESLYESTMGCNGASACRLVGLTPPDPGSAATNTMSQACSNSRDSSSSASNEASSPGSLSTHISGVNVPPWPASKRARCSAVASASTPAVAKTNSRR